MSVEALRRDIAGLQEQIKGKLVEEKKVIETQISHFVGMVREHYTYNKLNATRFNALESYFDGIQSSAGPSTFGRPKRLYTINYSSLAIKTTKVKDFERSVFDLAAQLRAFSDDMAACDPSLVNKMKVHKRTLDEQLLKHYQSRVSVMNLFEALLKKHQALIAEIESHQEAISLHSRNIHENTNCELREKQKRIEELEHECQQVRKTLEASSEVTRTITATATFQEALYYTGAAGKSFQSGLDALMALRGSISPFKLRIQTVELESSGIKRELESLESDTNSAVSEQQVASQTIIQEHLRRFEQDYNQRSAGNTRDIQFIKGYIVRAKAELSTYRGRVEKQWFKIFRAGRKKADFVDTVISYLTTSSNDMTRLPREASLADFIGQIVERIQSMMEEKGKLFKSEGVCKAKLSNVLQQLLQAQTIMASGEPNVLTIPATVSSELSHAIHQTYGQFGERVSAYASAMRHKGGPLSEIDDACKNMRERVEMINKKTKLSVEQLNECKKQADMQTQDVSSVVKERRDMGFMQKPLGVQPMPAIEYKMPPSPPPSGSEQENGVALVVFNSGTSSPQSERASSSNNPFIGSFGVNADAS